MSTQLREVGTMVEVSSVVGPGSRRKIPRNPVWVPKKDVAKMTAAIVAAAVQARKDFGVAGHEEVPVV